MKSFLFNSIGLFLLLGISVMACRNTVTSTPDNRTKEAVQDPATKEIPHSTDLIYDPMNDPSLVSQYVRAIFQDSNGHYWFAPAGESVARYDGNNLKYYPKSDFFYGNDNVDREQGNSVHAIAEAHNGNLWFGTYTGVVKYDPNAAGGASFRSYTEKHGLRNVKVGRKSILVDRSGTVWVGTQGGVFQYDPSADKRGAPCFSLFDLLPLINVKDILEDKAGNIWFASANQGVFRYNAQVPKDQRGVDNLLGPPGLGDNVAGGIAEDKAGNLWFTMKGGICRYDRDRSAHEWNSYTQYTTADGLGGSEVWGIHMEASGVLWISARGSTTRFDPSLPIADPTAFTVFTPADGLNCCVQSMYQDRGGRMWWGSGQGLYRYDGTHFYQVRKDGPW